MRISSGRRNPPKTIRPERPELDISGVFSANRCDVRLGSRHRGRPAMQSANPPTSDLPNPLTTRTPSSHTRTLAARPLRRRPTVPSRNLHALPISNHRTAARRRNTPWNSAPKDWYYVYSGSVANRFIRPRLRRPQARGSMNEVHDALCANTSARSAHRGTHAENMVCGRHSTRRGRARPR